MTVQNTVISILWTAVTLTACGDSGGTSEATTNPSTSGVSTTETDPTETDPGETDPGETDTPTGAPTETGEETGTTVDPTGTTTGEPETGTTSAETGEPETTTIRVVHLSPGAPAVDIFANGDGSAPAVDGLMLRNSITLAVPAGEYEFAIAADGSPIEDAVFSVPKLSYEAGKTYTVVAVGKLAENTFDILRLEDDTAGLDPTQVRLQITHAAPAAPFAEVDVWAGGDVNSLAELIPDFKFKSSATADVGPNDLTVALDIDNDAAPDAVWAIAGAALAPGVGAVVNVFAYSDEKDAPSLQVVAFDGPAIQLDPV